MKVLIVGANGQIGTLLVKNLKESGKHTPVAMIRKEEQKAKFREQGIETVLADLEGSVAQLARVMQGIDAIVFTAGSGGSTGYDKTLLIDLDGAVKVMEAAEQSGVKRFVMVSAIQAHNRESWTSIKPYYVAKHYADEMLKRSGLTYTILRPGALENKEGTGKIRVAADITSEGKLSIPRADVAKVIMYTLDNEHTFHKSFDLVSGEQPIEDALNSL